MFKRGTLTRGAPLSGVRRAYSKPPIWCFANTGNCYFWHVPTTTNQFFDTLTMQVSSWIAERLAVPVEFAVFLISSTTLFRACLWQALFSYETLLSYATLWWHGSLSNQVGRAKHAWRFRSAELRSCVRSDA